jgi:macrolide transport system ATP-binding/permease protein
MCIRRCGRFEAILDSVLPRYSHWLQILMVETGFVLLIVCANVANLMLVCGMDRRRETSLRIALGARASRIVSQEFTQSSSRALYHSSECFP